VCVGRQCARRRQRVPSRTVPKLIQYGSGRPGHGKKLMSKWVAGVNGQRHAVRSTPGRVMQWAHTVSASVVVTPTIHNEVAALCTDSYRTA